MDVMIRKRVRAYGRVQGVFFRDTCRREALACGVSGWVRNLPDGSVEALFQGEPADVERMVAWARRGPHRARVTRLDVSDDLSGASGDRSEVDGDPSVASGAASGVVDEPPATPDGFDIRPVPSAWVP